MCRPSREDGAQPQVAEDWGGWRGGDRDGSSSDFSRETKLERMAIFWVRESGFKMLLKSKDNEPKPNKMTFKRNKYKILHLGFKKITYVSTALKSSGEKKNWGF